MTTASNMRDAFLTFVGGVIGKIGVAAISVGGLAATYPWNYVCIVVGVLFAVGGTKLFLKGHDA